MAILVTGGAGYIGSHVVRQMTERGEEVVVVDNLSTGFPQALIHGENLVRADVRVPVTYERVFEQYKIDSVLHFAASIVVPESVREPLKYYSNNTGGMLSLLSQCVRYKVRHFIFSSTAAVYGTCPDGFCHEESVIDPASPYGASKAMSERILAETARAEKMGFVTLRYFNVAGADPQGRMGQSTRDATHLIKICNQAAVGLREQVEIFGDDYPTSDGTCIRDYVHVEDLAQGHILALDYLRAGKESQILNVGYGVGSSVLQVVETAKKVTGMDFKVIKAQRRAGDTPKLVASAKKIREVLGWKPRYASLEKIIEDSFEWEKKLARS